MKNFEINKQKYRLIRETHCFCLYKVGINTKKNIEALSVIGYFHSLDNVVKELFNLHVLDSGETKSLLACIKETYTLIKDILLLE